MKDPAFLFYSKEVYEDTRTLLPEERACYFDLLMYQHQRGNIPDDIPRLLMYCSGISEATLTATLKGSFKRVEGGWYNEWLQDRVNERERYKEDQSVNGKIGQFYKSAKRLLSPSEYQCLRGFFGGYTKQDILVEVEKFKKKNTEGYPLATLKGLLKHIANANADVNKLLESGVEKREDTFDRKRSLLGDTSLDARARRIEEAGDPLERLLNSDRGDKVRQAFERFIRPKDMEVAKAQMSASLVKAAGAENISNASFLYSKVWAWLNDKAKFEQYKMTVGEVRSVEEKRARSVWEDAYTPELQALMEERLEPSMRDQFVSECIAYINSEGCDALVFKQKVRSKLDGDLGKYRKLTDEEREYYREKAEEYKRRLKISVPTIKNADSRLSSHSNDMAAI